MSPRRAAPGDSKKEYHMSTPTLKKTDDVTKVREYIRKLIDLKYGTLTAYAAKEEVSLQYISNVMSGNKPIPSWMYKRFKINHVVQEHWEVTLAKAA
jgi:hypothetical protein